MNQQRKRLAFTCQGNSCRNDFLCVIFIAPEIIKAVEKQNYKDIALIFLVWGGLSALSSNRLQYGGYCHDCGIHPASDKYSPLHIRSDDIQQMENYDSIKNEFISLFDEIACSKVQLVFAASTHPSELRKLDNRIRNRISSGVVIKVEPPDKETREKIIEEKIKEMNVRFHRQSIVFLANKFQTNVRVLEGHIKTIGAYVTGTVGNNSRNNFEVTVDIVKEALKDSLNVHAKLVTVDNIKQVVAQYYGISVLDIDSAARPNQIAYPRMMAMALARVLTGTSFPSLGKQFGNKDHSTVMNACNKVKKKINVEHDPKYTEDWENLNLQLTE